MPPAGRDEEHLVDALFEVDQHTTARGCGVQGTGQGTAFRWQHSDGSIQMAAAGAPWSLGTHPCVHGDGKIEQQQARAGPSSGGRASKPSAGGSLRSKHCSPVVEENSPGSASGGSIHHRLRPARLTLQLKELSTSFVMRGGRVVQDTDVGQQQLAGRNGEG